MAAKRKKVQGLRRRWITGSIGPVVVILLLVGVLISVGFASNYYNSAKSTLRAKAAAGADYFNTYVMTSYREYYRSATLYAAAFEEGDRIELQFLNSAGRVEVLRTPSAAAACGFWPAVIHRFCVKTRRSGEGVHIVRRAGATKYRRKRRRYYSPHL